MTFDLRRYTLTNGSVALAIVGLAIWSIANGDRFGGITILVGVTAAGWWSWPTRGPHLEEAAAKAEMGPGDVIVYWRPGCIHCARLAVTSRLTSWPDGAPKRFLVNVWRDPDAATTVQLLRGGFQTVPTVVDHQGQLLDPTPSGIKSRRRLGAPQP